MDASTLFDDRPLTATERRERTEELFDLAHAEPTDIRKSEILRVLVVINTPVARSIAHRYRNRGCDLEDLEQTACLALVRAVQRFDPTSGHDFLSFAVPSIRGEVRRHFRDLGWMVRPPRSIQELRPLVAQELAKRDETTGRPPSAEEIAKTLGVQPAAVRQAMQAHGCFAPASLDAPVGGTPGPVLGDVLVDSQDPGFAAAEARTLLGTVLDDLSARDRVMLQMRFVEELTQAEIADLLGLTQPHVSRLLQAILDDLRDLLTAPTEPLAPRRVPPRPLPATA